MTNVDVCKTDSLKCHVVIVSSMYSSKRSSTKTQLILSEVHRTMDVRMDVPRILQTVNGADGRYTVKRSFKCTDIDI